MKHLLKNIVSLIIERRPGLPPLAVAVALTSMPALAQGAAQASSPAVAAQTEEEAPDQVIPALVTFLNANP
jgi:hypothetical protein